MTYIELYGLPGAGKTTITAPVIDMLRRDGLQVANLKDVYLRNCKGNSKVFVLLEMIIRFRRYPIYWRILRYGLSISIKKECIKYLIKLLFLVHQIYESVNSGLYDVILCEEGIVQYITSLCYLEDLPDTKLLSKIIEIINKTINPIAIYCEISEEESLLRITKRSNSISLRFSSKIPIDVLEKAIEKRGRNMLVVAKYLPTRHTLSMLLNEDVLKRELYDLSKRTVSL